MSIAEADLSLTQMAFEAENGPQQRDPGDQHLLVKFELKPKQDMAKSAEEGRPIFEEVEYVHIMVPGQKDNVYFQPATDYDRQRFPEHYAAFKNRVEGNDGELLNGTPLASWPAVSRAQVEELKYFNVRTVEQLAHMPDSNAQNFMGVQALRAKAKLFLEAAESNAATEKLQSELEKRDNEIAALQKAVEEQARMIEEMKQDAVPDSERHPEPSRRRGRPSSSK